MILLRLRDIDEQQRGIWGGCRNAVIPFIMKDGEYMILKQCFLTRNDCYQKGQKMTGGKPTGIVVHSTGANNPTLKRYVQPLTTDENYDELIADLGVNKYKNSWNTSYKAGETTRQVCVHAFIGKNAAGVVETYQTLPFDVCCWGCASGSKGSYNRNPARIQFEICEDGLTNRTYFDAAFKEAIEFCAYLCKTYGFGTDKICSHHEAYLAGYGNNHGDCDHWLKRFGLNMDWFRAEVQKLLDADKQVPSDNQPEEKPSCPPIDNMTTEEKAIGKGDLVQIAEGAYYYSGDKAVPDWVQKQHWYVKGVNGDRAVIDKNESGKNSINSPIHVKYLSVVKTEEEKETKPSQTETVTNTTVLNADARTIWDFLLIDIRNEVGVAGLMGNLHAESGLNPKNLQNSHEKTLGYTDETYTEAVDNGSYDNFVDDHAGYGLAQWTYHSRKQKLLEYAKGRGASVGDLMAQLFFLIEELRSYKSVYSGLKHATSIQAASDLVLTEFERPANQGEEVKQKRASYGQMYYDAFADSEDNGSCCKCGCPCKTGEKNPDD